MVGDIGAHLSPIVAAALKHQADVVLVPGDACVEVGYFDPGEHQAMGCGHGRLSPCVSSWDSAAIEVGAIGRN